MVWRHEMLVMLAYMHNQSRIAKHAPHCTISNLQMGLYLYVPAETPVALWRRAGVMRVWISPPAATAITCAVAVGTAAAAIVVVVVVTVVVVAKAVGSVACEDGLHVAYTDHTDHQYGTRVRL